jgi:hypothetical protein
VTGRLRIVADFTRGGLKAQAAQLVGEQFVTDGLRLSRASDTVGG